MPCATIATGHEEMYLLMLCRKRPPLPECSAAVHMLYQGIGAYFYGAND
jgi:hypothetical protein